MILKKIDHYFYVIIEIRKNKQILSEDERNRVILLPFLLSLFFSHLCFMYI